MTRTPMILAAGALALAACRAAPEARAGFPPHHRRATPPPGRPRAFEHTPRRAGNPFETSHLAHPTNTPAYSGGYVGGGTAFLGDARGPEEGTWGRDYVGTHGLRRVFLRWSHGRREQGGTGSYRTDGPPVPDLIGRTAAALRVH